MLRVHRNAEIDEKYRLMIRVMNSDVTKRGTGSTRTKSFRNGRGQTK